MSTAFNEFSHGFGIQGSTNEEMREAEQQNCCWEYYIQNFPAYLTHNINLDAGLANGTYVKEDLLAFDSARILACNCCNYLLIKMVIKL